MSVYFDPEALALLFVQQYLSEQGHTTGSLCYHLHLLPRLSPVLPDTTHLAVHQPMPHVTRTKASTNKLNRQARDGTVSRQQQFTTGCWNWLDSMHQALHPGVCLMHQRFC